MACPPAGLQEDVEADIERAEIPQRNEADADANLARVQRIMRDVNAFWNRGGGEGGGAGKQDGHEENEEQERENEQGYEADFGGGFDEDFYVNNNATGGEETMDELAGEGGGSTASGAGGFGGGGGEIYQNTGGVTRTGNESLHALAVDKNQVACAPTTSSKTIRRPSARHPDAVASNWAVNSPVGKDKAAAAVLSTSDGGLNAGEEGGREDGREHSPAPCATASERFSPCREDRRFLRDQSVLSNMSRTITSSTTSSSASARLFSPPPLSNQRSDTPATSFSGSPPPRRKVAVESSSSDLQLPVPPSVGCPFGAPGRYVDEEGLQNLIRMVPPKPLDVAKTIPTTKEEVPVFSSTALSVFMIAETLKEVGEARFQALEKGRNECIAIEGNVAVYTSDGHFLLGHFANPLGVAMGNNEVVAEVIKQTGLKLKRTAEMSPVYPHKASDPRSGEKEGKNEKGKKATKTTKVKVVQVLSARKVGKVRYTRKRGVHGTAHYCFWTSTGYNIPAALKPSSEFGVSAKSLNATANLGDTLDMVLEMGAKLVYAVSPTHHAYLKSEFDLKVKGSSFTRLVDSPFSIYPNIALVHNHAVAEHVDPLDPKDSFGFMSPYGDYSGGQLILQQFGLKLGYRPGDFVLIRARLINHRVASFAGWRHCAVAFWREWLLNMSRFTADWINIKANRPVTFGQSLAEVERMEAKKSKEEKERAEEERARKRQRVEVEVDVETGDIWWG